MDFVPRCSDQIALPNWGLCPSRPSRFRRIPPLETQDWERPEGLKLVYIRSRIIGSRKIVNRIFQTKITVGNCLRAIKFSLL